MPAKSNNSSSLEPTTTTVTTPSPTPSIATQSQLLERSHSIESHHSKAKAKFLQPKQEYPTSSLNSRHFTLKRQKRISENRPIPMKKRTSSMRKSRSLDADRAYSLASIQSPLWVTLTNARTIEELSREQI
uniref:Uncharacterized protein n=1 Tax=Stomoxys calcitrans TaxID=35570 RepID=A0A1I8QDX0_STOCA